MHFPAIEPLVIGLVVFILHLVALALVAKGILVFTKLGDLLDILLDHFIHAPAMRRELAVVIKYVNARIPGGIGSAEGYNYAFAQIMKRFPFLPHEDVEHLIHAIDADLPHMLTAVATHLETVQPESDDDLFDKLTAWTQSVKASWAKENEAGGSVSVAVPATAPITVTLDVNEKTVAAAPVDPASGVVQIAIPEGALQPGASQPTATAIAQV